MSNAPDFEANDLVPAVVQDDKTGEVLMLAHMNKEAWQQTMESGFATFFSRSRQEIWRKGETSGNVMQVVSAHVDCDDDSVLLRVNIDGPACHTGNRSCFYREVEKD